jgi:dTDP-4-dehydrorhamnose 3,5-epimerase
LPAIHIFNHELMTLQNYALTPIAGVQLIDLTRHVDESGSFTELMRLDAQGFMLDARGAPLAIGPPPELFRPRQYNWSELDPGVIRAFHIHKKQTDVWFVPAHEKILVNLVDLRRWPEKARVQPGEIFDPRDNGVSKPLITQYQRVVLGDGRSRLLVIPPLVAHGFRTLHDERTRLLYAVNVPFDPHPDQCDEWRLPWDLFGADRWELTQG